MCCCVYKTMMRYASIAFCAISILACRYEFPQGNLLHVSKCKVANRERGAMAANPLWKECIHYEYDGFNKLYFTHENRTFSSSSGQIAANVTINSNTIFINEKVSRASACESRCYYDLEYVIDNLSEGIYSLKMAHMDQFEVDIDLTASYSGSYCIARSDERIREK